MANKFTIKETDVLRFIIKEFNDTPFSSKIPFALSSWSVYSKPNGDFGGLIIQRMALDNERFDIKEEFNEETYARNKKSFIPISVSSLNGEYTALNNIKEAVFTPQVNFLVYIDNPDVQVVLNETIQYIKNKFIQYQTKFEVEYLDIDNPNNKNKIKENLTIIATAGGLSYGEIENINGKNYMVYSMPLTLMVTNHGDFANQEQISIGCSAIKNEANEIIMFDLEPIEWGWGTVIDNEATQLLNDVDLEVISNSMEVKSLPKSKGYSFTMIVQIDFKNPLLKHWFIESRKPNLNLNKYYLKSTIKTFNETTKQYEIDPELTLERELLMVQCMPVDNLSKGEKITFTLTFVPYLNELLLGGE